MRKKTLNQKITFIIISIVFIFIIFVSLNKIYITYKQNLDKQKLESERNEIANSREWKKTIIEKQDGWYYFMSIDRVKNETSEYLYYIRMDGCNIKYQTLDNNYVIYYDEENPADFQKIPATPPNLVNSYASKDGIKTEETELEEINDLLEQENWQRKINAADLKSLTFVNFDYNDVIVLWNELYDMNYSKKSGQYDKLGLCSLTKEEKESNYYQVGLVLNYGTIAVIKIDFVDNNGIYLTDKMENGSATKEEKEIYSNIEKIENEIEKNGFLNLDNKFSNLKKDTNYESLFNLLNKIESSK